MAPKYLTLTLTNAKIVHQENITITSGINANLALHQIAVYAQVILVLQVKYALNAKVVTLFNRILLGKMFAKRIVLKILIIMLHRKLALNALLDNTSINSHRNAHTAQIIAQHVSLKME